MKHLMGSLLLTLVVLASTTGIVGAASHATCGTDLACVKTAGDTAVQRRVLDLNNLSNAAQQHPHLTATQQAAIVQDAQATLASVQAFTPQIDTAASVATARSLILHLQTQVRVYDVVVPRDYWQLDQEQQAYIQGQFVAAEPQIQQAIQTAAGTGIDVSQAQQHFTDLQAKVSDAGQQNAKAQPLFATITVAAFNASSATVASAFVRIRTDLQQGRFDLEAAYQDLTQILAVVHG